MQGLQRAARSRGSIVTGLEVYVVEGRIACSTSDEIELARVSSDDRVALQAPVGSRGGGAESEGLIRGRGSVVKVEIEFTSTGTIQGD